MNSKLKLIIGAVVVAALIVVANHFGVTEKINNLLTAALDWIESLGPIGYLAFILIYIIASALFISGAVLTLGAGLAFGVVKGSILVSAASVLAATVSFLIGRYIARDKVAKLIEKQPKFKAIDSAVAKEGWKIVGLTRLSPIFPFVFLNYAFGVTQVSLRDYVVASWIGMMPGTVMYVYLGSVGKTVADKTMTPEEKVLFVVGLLVTVAVTVYVTKIAKKALDSQLENETNTPLPTAENSL